MITQLGRKIAPALWVVPEKAPYCVIRRSFGVTKLLSSRLAWHFFSFNSVVWWTKSTPLMWILPV